MVLRVSIFLCILFLAYVSVHKSTTEPISGEGGSVFDNARAEYDYELMKDPLTGKIPVNAMLAERNFAAAAPTKEGVHATGVSRIASSHAYFPAGPLNAGGRTRAVAYDKRYNGTTNQIMIAGGVSGGIMRSADGGTSWQSVAPNIDIHSLGALAQN